MYYGYRCYNSDNKSIGWLYTFGNESEYVWTNTELNWCKKWKTERGAKKHFEHYNSRWKFKSKGGYLKIEVMPEFEEPESAASRRQRMLEEWDTLQELDNNKTEETTTNFQFELIKGLPEEHGTYLFLLKDGSIKEGYFGSFPHPNSEKDIRIANCEDEQFYYTNCIGWLKKIE